MLRLPPYRTLSQTVPLSVNSCCFSPVREGTSSTSDPRSAWQPLGIPGEILLGPRDGYVQQQLRDSKGKKVWIHCQRLHIYSKSHSSGRLSRETNYTST